NVQEYKTARAFGPRRFVFVVSRDIKILGLRTVGERSGHQGGSFDYFHHRTFQQLDCVHQQTATAHSPNAGLYPRPGSGRASRWDPADRLALGPEGAAARSEELHSAARANRTR